MNSAGVAAPGGGGGAPSGGGSAGGEGGGSTALVPSGGGEIAPTGGDGAGEGDGGELAPSGGGEAGTGGDGTFRALERGKPTKQTRGALEALRQANPAYGALVRAIPRAFAIRDSFFNYFPGRNAFKALDEVLAFVNTVGRQKGKYDHDRSLASAKKAIEAYRQNSDDTDDSDSLYAAGDPKLLAKMTKTPAAKAALCKLMPHALQMWEDIAPNQFSARLAATFLGHMKSEVAYDKDRNPVEEFDLQRRVPRALRTAQAVAKAENLPPELKQAANDLLIELSYVNAYIQTLQSMTQLQPEDLAPKQTGNEDERRQLDRERLSLRNGQWRTNRDGIAKQIAQSEWTRQAKGLTLTSRQEQNIMSSFNRRLDVARRNQADYQSSVEGFSGANDKDGYLAYHRTFFAENIPRILKDEIRQEVGGQPRKPQATAPATTPQVRPGSGPQRTEAVTRLNEMPGVNDLLHTGDSRDLRGKRQGRLSDIGAEKHGKKRGDLVQW